MSIKYTNEHLQFSKIEEPNLCVSRTLTHLNPNPSRQPFHSSYAIRLLRQANFPGAPVSIFLIHPPPPVFPADTAGVVERGWLPKYLSCFENSSSPDRSAAGEAVIEWHCNNVSALMKLGNPSLTECDSFPRF